VGRPGFGQSRAEMGKRARVSVKSTDKACSQSLFPFFYSRKNLGCESTEQRAARGLRPGPLSCGAHIDIWQEQWRG
jgi:hypothetical protein